MASDELDLALAQVIAELSEIYRTAPQEGGALARQSKDTAMWVHLFHLIGALWILVRLRYGSMGP